MMTFFKIVGLLMGWYVIYCAGNIPDISDNVAYLGVCIMLAGFMAGGGSLNGGEK